MDLPHLYRGKIIKRYNRFLIDIILEHNNEQITAHCPNSGSMLGLINGDFFAHVSKNNNPLNKLSYKLELIENNQGYFIGVNTSITNKLVLEALQNKQIKDLAEFNNIQCEKKFNNSRFDFLLSNGSDQCFVEVKSVSLIRDNNMAEFPDAITKRGQKHLEDLILAKQNSIHGVNLYIIQREDANKFSLAKDIDINYYLSMVHAKKNGVKFLCYDCIVNPKEIKINKQIDIIYD